MLKKILKLAHVGRFDTWSAPGDVELHRFSVVYGSNGAGKSTIVAMLRAAKDGDSGRVIARKRLASKDAPKVSLRFEEGTYSFDGTTWGGLPNAPMIDLFDREFIESNVYVGRDVGPDQRTALLSLALGDVEVARARAVEDIASSITDVQSEMRRTTDALSSIANGYSLGVDEFRGLSAVDAPDERIASIDRRLVDARNAQTIAARPALKPMPAIPVALDRVDLAEILGTSANSIGDGAESLVREHLGRRLGDAHARSWVRTGVDYLGTSDDCPFCGQDTNGLELVRAYRAHFDTSYRDLVSAVTSWRDRLESFVVDASRWSGVADSNRQTAAMWSESVGVAPDIGEVEEAHRDLISRVSVVRACVETKLAAPIEPIDADEKLRELADADDRFRAAYSTHQHQIEAFSARIVEFKAGLSRTSVADLELERRRVQAAARRHEPECSDLNARIEETRRAKTELEEKKKLAQAEFDSAKASHLATFGDLMNRILVRLGAGYSIQSFTSAMPGGRPSASYLLDIDGGRFPVGARNSSGTTFANVLSEGDKTTLALAVFFAHLDRRPDLDRRIVVFDDPMSSLDEDRRSATRELIRDIAERSKQTIVFSHDATFLLSLMEWSPVGHIKQLRLMNSQKRFDDWSATEHCKAEYFKRLERVTRFAREGGDDAVARERGTDLRLLLEEHFRFRFPNAWAPGEWLGDFVGKAKAAKMTSPASMLGALDVAELGRLNAFSAKFHHAGGIPPNPPSNIAEIKQYAKRVVELISGETL